MKKILFLALLTITVIFPSISHAQVDARCWLEQECFDARKIFLKVESPAIGAAGWDKVFRQDDTTAQLCGGKIDAAGKKIGFCLPATAAKTKISIGGVTEFSGLAEFIAFIYKYGLSVASILAVLMIIYAGVQWTISGGNTEAISSAQHKITGAVIGLVILAAAYTILYTVNPDLVNLRPPNAWMINTQKISAPYCNELKTGLISKNASNKTGEKITTEQKKAGFSAISSDGWAPTSTAKCENDYFVQQTGALTCTGTVCPTSEVCFNKDGNGNKCITATIAGTISNSSAEAALLTAAGGLARTVFGEGWTYPWVANGSTKELEIYIVCNNGAHRQIDIQYPVDPGNSSSLRPAEQKQVYAVTATTEEIKKQWENYCKTDGDVKGFVLAVEFNESGDGVGLEEHMLGRSLTAGVGQGRVFQAYDLMNESNDWKPCIFRNARVEHFFTSDELIGGIKLDINASNVADIDNSDEDEVSRKIYYTGTKQPGGEEVCN